MSLAKIKQKETKGKKNVLPKLRTILANPYKQHSPVLPESEVMQFRNILKAAIDAGGCAPQAFATKAAIHLGLESSLRAINAKRFSCVFISLSLRPSHIFRLIATSAAVKAPTAPIYAQPKLEELTEELFGVRALTLVLPLNLDAISTDLAKWVIDRKRPLKEKKETVFSAPPAKKLKRKVPEPQKELIRSETPEPAIASSKDWNGDYISCSNDRPILQVDQVDVESETQLLGAALNKLIEKGQKKAEVTPTNPKSEAKSELPITEPMEQELDVDELDEFLPAELDNYQPLTVHQITSNPDKQPKKKRNKNKKKSNKTK